MHCMTSGMNSSSISHLRGRTLPAALLPDSESAGKFPVSPIHLSERRYRLFRYLATDLVWPLADHTLRLGKPDEVACRLRKAGAAAPDHADLDDRQGAR